MRITFPRAARPGATANEHGIQGGQAGSLPDPLERCDAPVSRGRPGTPATVGFIARCIHTNVPLTGGCAAENHGRVDFCRDPAAIGHSTGGRGWVDSCLGFADDRRALQPQERGLVVIKRSAVSRQKIFDRFLNKLL